MFIPESRLDMTNALSTAVHLWGEAKERQQSGTRHGTTGRRAAGNSLASDLFGRVSTLNLMVSARNVTAPRSCQERPWHTDEEVEPWREDSGLECQAERNGNKNSLLDVNGSNWKTASPQVNSDKDPAKELRSWESMWMRPWSSEVLVFAYLNPWEPQAPKSIAPKTVPISSDSFGK